jgi:hypothetical protein
VHGNRAADAWCRATGISRKARAVGQPDVRRRHAALHVDELDHVERDLIRDAALLLDAISGGHRPMCVSTMEEIYC